MSIDTKNFLKKSELTIKQKKMQNSLDVSTIQTRI